MNLTKTEKISSKDIQLNNFLKTQNEKRLFLYTYERYLL